MLAVFWYNKAMANQLPSETNLKGRMAESLVHDLLIESGNEVFKIGFEKILPAITDAVGTFKKNYRVSEKIRSIPDFLVIDKKKIPYLIEVKFRWNPEGHSNDLKNLEHLRKHWEEAYIVFVNCSQKPFFRVSYFPFFKNNNKIVATPIENFKPFNVSESRVKAFNKLVEKYLTPTLLAGTKQKIK